MRTDWSAALRAAARLGVRPREFWALSLAEWRALAGGAGPVLTRARLEGLMRSYPDGCDGRD